MKFLTVLAGATTLAIASPAVAMDKKPHFGGGGGGGGGGQSHPVPAPGVALLFALAAGVIMVRRGRNDV